jgi:AraC-like DNA-binding protein
MHKDFCLSGYVIEIIASVKEFIDSHPLEWKTTDQLAADAAINRKLLQKGFKLIYKINISEYQSQRRMEAASEMLEQGRLSKKQIAKRCGYNSYPNFSIAFKRTYNTSPSDWQNRHAVSHGNLFYNHIARHAS